MNSENSKTPEPYRLLLNLSDKIDLKKELINILLYQILVDTIYGDILNYLTDHTRY